MSWKTSKYQWLVKANVTSRAGRVISQGATAVGLLGTACCMGTYRNSSFIGTVIYVWFLVRPAAYKRAQRDR